MITVGKNGRHKSVTTFEEIDEKANRTLASLTDGERDLVAALGQELSVGDQDIHEQLHGHIYHTIPVSMEQFLEDPYYLGDSLTTIYPAVKQDLISLYERPYREIVLCLHPDTRVLMGDGDSRTMAQLISQWDLDAKPVPVYSVNKEGIMVPSMSEQIRYTGEDDYYRVTLDDGSDFTCNARHQMVMLDGSKRMVMDMSKGDRLMPFRAEAGHVSSTGGEQLSRRVMSVDKIGHGPVCCMTVPEYSNFAIVTKDEGGVQSGVVSSNTGGLGVGKSYSASIVVCRLLYEFSCMISPQKSMGLGAGAEILIPLFSKNLTLSRIVLKTAIDEKIRESPYFMTLFTPQIRKEFSLFPHNIRVAVASYGSDRITGTNVAGAILDETNFPPKRHGQHISTGFGQKVGARHFDIVEKIYSGLVMRIKSRFQALGDGFPGMVILCSSAATTESFTARKMRDGREDPDIFLRDHTQWTSKPRSKFSEEVFWVLCSTSAMRSRILSEDEYAAVTDKYLDDNDAFVMDIPIDFKSDFELNMEDALRDIAGFPTEAISQFIQRPKMIQVCVHPEREHPFDRDEWVAGGPGMLDWDRLVSPYERRLPGGHVETGYRPIRNPTAMRWCHIDASLSGDSSGFAIGHIDGWVDVVRTDIEGYKQVDKHPFYIVDFMLRINPPPAEQIYMPDLRVLMYKFMERGFKFLGYSSDSFQYAEMHQQLRRKGIATHLVSMDTSTEPYDELKSAFYEQRIEIYEYKPFIEEFKKLEYDRLVGKIDHPQAGCFIGSTRIPLLDGTSVMLEDLDGSDAWVYSCDENGQVVPGKARGRLTKYTGELVDVRLDSGAVERCTPEHRWLLRSGEYKRAIDLIPGVDEMMLSKVVQPEFAGVRPAHSCKICDVAPIELDNPVPVYDLEVGVFSNFALSSGVFVHNSKDVSDAVAGVIYGLKKSASMMPTHGKMERAILPPHKDAWVTPMVPAEQVDVDAVKAARDGLSAEEFMPILFGDD